MLRFVHMQYKRLIMAGIFLLLVLVIITAIWLTQSASPSTLLKDSMRSAVHKDLYEQATGVWNSDLALEDLSRDTSSVLRMVWQQPVQTYNHFLVTITNPATNWTRTESGEHDRVSLELTDLNPQTFYTMVVRACLDPNCLQWIISDHEVNGMTEPMRWAVTAPPEGLSEWPEVNEWQTPFALASVDLTKEDGTAFTDEDKNALVIERVQSSPNGNPAYWITLTTTESAQLFATWLNP